MRSNLYGCIGLLYVNDVYVEDVHLLQCSDESYDSYLSRQYPLCSTLDVNYVKYPCISLVVYHGDKYSSILSTRRNLYLKWKSGSRNPQDYMYVFRYADVHQRLGNPLRVNFHILHYFHNRSEEQLYLDMCFRSYIVCYRRVWVDENVETISRLVKGIELEKNVPVESPVESPKPVVTQTYRERYRSTHRAEISSSNRKYYQSRKSARILSSINLDGIIDAK